MRERLATFSQVLFCLVLTSYAQNLASANTQNSPVKVCTVPLNNAHLLHPYKRRNGSFMEWVRHQRREKTRDTYQIIFPEGYVPPKLRIQAQTGPLSLVEAEASGSLESYLLLAQVKEWTSQEIAQVQGVLSSLVSLYPQFFDRISKNGITSLIRVKRDVEIKDDGTMKIRDKNTAWVSSSQHFIYIADPFFDIASEPLPKSYRPHSTMADYHLIHEAAHAFDYEGATALPYFSMLNEFVTLSSFVPDLSQKDYVVPREIQDAIGKPQDGNVWSQSYTRKARAYGFPSFYATTNIREFFAEAVTLSHLNPELMRSINPKVFSWIEKNVLR